MYHVGILSYHHMHANSIVVIRDILTALELTIQDLYPPTLPFTYSLDCPSIHHPLLRMHITNAYILACQFSAAVCAYVHMGRLVQSIALI